MSTDAIDKIRQLIASGADAQAKSALVRLVRTDPENVQAWELLASLCEDPSQQMDCYRQILRVDPANRHALERLATLQGQASALPSSDRPANSQAATLRCQHCGGQMTLQFFGETLDKRAVCPYCRHTVDVPDTFRRVQRRREEQQLPHGRRVVETVLIETRSDRGAEGVTALLPELEVLQRALEKEGLQDFDEVVQRFRGQSFHVVSSSESSTTFQVENAGCLARLLQLLGIKISAGDRQGR